MNESRIKYDQISFRNMALDFWYRRYINEYTPNRNNNNGRSK